MYSTIRREIADYLTNVWLDEGCLIGEMEIDESYIARLEGGAEEDHQIWALGLLQREPEKVRVFIVPNRRRLTLENLISVQIEEGARIYTDGYPSYNGLTDLGYGHYVSYHT